MSNSINESGDQKIVEEPGNGALELFPLPVNQSFLLELLTDIFTNYWDVIHLGVAVQGAVRDILNSRPVKNRHTLANPESLEQFAEMDLVGC